MSLFFQSKNSELLIEKSLEGIEYYQNYYRNFLLKCVSAAMVLWIVIMLTDLNQTAQISFMDLDPLLIIILIFVFSTLAIMFLLREFRRICEVRRVCNGLMFILLLFSATLAIPLGHLRDPAYRPAVQVTRCDSVLPHSLAEGQHNLFLLCCCGHRTARPQLLLSVRADNIDRGPGGVQRWVAIRLYSTFR